MATAKEVKVTFRGIDQTRQAFAKINHNFRKLGAGLKDLGQGLNRLQLGFSKVGMAIASASSIAALGKIIESGAEIGRLAAKLDISTSALSELKYAGAQCGVEFETLSSGLSNLSANIAGTTDGAKDAQQALQLLRLSASELAQLSPDQQFELVAQGLIRVASPSDRAKLATTLFGSEGKKLLPILEQGASGIDSLRQEARKLGASLSSEDCASMAKFKSELEKLQTVLTSLMTTVLIPILPAITAFFTAVREGHPAVTFIITAISSLLALRLAAWFVAATAAVRGFSIALMANPLALMAVATSTTIAALVSLVKWLKRGKESVEEYNTTVAETINLENINWPKQEQAVATSSKRNDVHREAKRIFEQTRTPLEKHNQQMEKLNNLLKQGLIDQDTYNRALEQSCGRLDTISTKSDEVFDSIKTHSNEAVNSLIDNFAKAAFGADRHTNSMKVSFKSLFASLQSELLKLTLQKGLNLLGGSGGLLGGLFSGTNIGSLFGGSFGGFFARGGTVKPGKAHVVGDGGEPELFVPNTVGSITPFSRLNSGGASGNNIIVHMNIQTPDLASFSYSRGQIAADMARQISRASRNL